MLHVNPLHAARLAMLEGALLALLRDAQAFDDPNELPDSLSVHLESDGAIDIEYKRGSITVSGEGL